MSLESIPYSDDWARVQMALGADLGERQGDKVILNPAERAIGISVIKHLEGVLATDQQEQGEHFDRAAWLPSPEDEAVITEAHRPHRRFLRGIDGLRKTCAQIVDNPDQFVPPLYDHQKAAILTTTNHLQNIDPFTSGGQGAYHEIAGGGGKSRIIAMLAEGFKASEDPADPNRVLIIAPDNAVLHELAGLDGRSGLGQYAPSLEVGLVNASYKQGDRPVVVTTRESARRAVARDASYLEKFDLILADEAHTITGAKTQLAFGEATRPIIGFTGTSGRVAEVLPQPLERFGDRELTEQGKLSAVQYWVAKTNEVIYETSTRKGYSEEELLYLSKLEGRQLIAVDIAMTFFRANMNGVFSCNNIAEAKKLARILNDTEVTLPDGTKRTIRVVAMVGDKKEDNYRTVRLLNQNVIQAVTIVNIDTGWDVSRMSFLVNLRPTASFISAAQRKARATRKYYDAEGNEVVAQVVDLVDTVAERRRPSFDRPKRTRQVLAATLMRETVYTPGMLIASEQDQGQRRVFSAEQFPPHLRWALTMARGVPFDRIAVFGAGVHREEAPPGKITRIEAARGLGVATSRLDIALTVFGAGDTAYINEALMEKLETHLDSHGVPVSAH